MVAERPLEDVPPVRGREQSVDLGFDRVGERRHPW